MLAELSGFALLTYSGCATLLDFGEKLLVTTEQRGHGSGSGVGVSEPVFQLFTLRRGLVIRQEDFLDQAEALENVGVSEQEARAGS
jgi:hypothetical protein